MTPTAFYSFCPLFLLFSQPKYLLASFRYFFFPWLSLSCLVSAPFKVYQQLGPRITSVTEVRGKGREGLFLPSEQVVSFSRVVKGCEGGSGLSRISHPREHSTTALFPSPHSDFQKYPDPQGHNRKLGDPKGRAQIGRATWDQGCKWINKDTA